MDEEGQIILPHEAISRLHLLPGLRLIIEEKKSKIIIELENEETRLSKQDGILIVDGKLTGEITDIVQMSRAERITSLLEDSLK